MPVRTFTGTIQQTILTSSELSSIRSFNLNKFQNSNIQWNQRVPTVLAGKTVAQLSDIPAVRIEPSVGISLTGEQYYDFGSVPTIRLFYYYDQVDRPAAVLLRATGLGIDCLLSWGRGRYNINNNFPAQLKGRVPNKVTAEAYNDRRPGCFAAPNYPATGVNFTITLQVEVTLECEGGLLDAPTCVNYCRTNLEECVTDYLDYCFPDRIGTRESCQTFFENYVANLGSLSEIDTKLNEYCANKYEGLGSLFASGNQTDIALCACHMPDEQYTNLREQVLAQFEGGELLNIPKRCLVPQCVDSAFKTTDIGKTCPLPQCLNIAGFTNNGTANNVSVNINQRGECGTIERKFDPGPDPEPEPSPQPEEPSGINIWLILGIVLGILILLVIVIVIIVFSTRKPKSNNTTVTRSTKPIST